VQQAVLRQHVERVVGRPADHDLVGRTPADRIPVRALIGIGFEQQLAEMRVGLRRARAFEDGVEPETGAGVARIRFQRASISGHRLVEAAGRKELVAG
jgi:hypothetical protein